MDKVVNLGEFNTKGGFWRPSFIEKNPVDYFIPFLPLERSHVKMCAKVTWKRKDIQLLNKSSTALQMSYYTTQKT